MSDLTPLAVTTASPEATHDLGRLLAGALRPGDFLALVGDLGAGKTCFVQGLAAGLGVAGRVASPTFILMRAHPGPVALYHADAYRLTSGGDLLDIGLEDWLADGVVALEWADLAPEACPEDVLTIVFSGCDDQRTLTFTARGPRSRALLEHLRSCAS